MYLNEVIEKSIKNKAKIALKSWNKDKFIIVIKGGLIDIKNPNSQYYQYGIKGKYNISDRFDLINKDKITIGWLPKYSELISNEWELR